MPRQRSSSSSPGSRRRDRRVRLLGSAVGGSSRVDPLHVVTPGTARSSESTAARVYGPPVHLCYRASRHADQPRPARTPPPQWRRIEPTRRWPRQSRAAILPSSSSPPSSRSAASPSSAPSQVYANYSRDLPDPRQLLETIDFNQQTVIYDRTGTVELAAFGSENRASSSSTRSPPSSSTRPRASRTRPSGRTPASTRWPSSRRCATRSRGRPARRLDDHPAARPRAAPAARPTDRTVDRKIKEIIQSIRLTQEYPGRRGQAGDHHRLPEPELLRQPELRHRRGRPGLLRGHGPHRS